jgi:LPXTG-motif cell wall-anchored protein
MVLTVAPMSSALAQSAGDRQYADPLVTDGQSDPQPAQPQGGDTPTSSPAEPSPAPAPDTTLPDGAEIAAPSEATLPRTGAEPLALALAGLALAACGALGLALPRRSRHARH